MKRGLKVDGTMLAEVSETEDARITPMKRGLKARGLSRRIVPASRMQGLPR